MKRICTIILLGLFGGTTALSAQEAKKGDRTDSQLVEEIDIRGHRRTPTSTIKSWIGTHEGDSYRPAQLDRDIRAIYATGHFTNVRVYVENGLHEGKIITFEVIERPIILEILYEGIDPAAEAEIVEEWQNQKLDVSKGAEYNPVYVRRAAAIIRDLLVRRGSQQAKVNPMVDQKTPTGVSIVFKVEE